MSLRNFDPKTAIEAVSACYGRGDPEAFKYLEELRSSDDAWPFASELLDLNEGSEYLPVGARADMITLVHHYGATLLFEKVRSDWNKLEDDDRNAIKEMLVGHVQSRSSDLLQTKAQTAVVTRLSSALALAAITEGSVKQVLNVAMEMAPVSVAGVLHVLSALPDQTKRVQQGRAMLDPILTELSTASDDILEFLDTIIQAATPHVCEYEPPANTPNPSVEGGVEAYAQLLYLALTTLLDWLEIASTLGAFLRVGSGRMLHALVALLPTAPFGEPVSAILSHALQHQEYPPSQAQNDAIALLGTALAQIGPPIVERVFESLLRDPSDPAALLERGLALRSSRWLCEVTSSMGEYGRNFIAAGSPEALTIVRVQLALVASPHRPSVAHRALEFFSSLQSEPLLKRAGPLKQLVFAQLLPILILQLTGRGHACKWWGVNERWSSSSGVGMDKVWEPYVEGDVADILDAAEQANNPVTGIADSDSKNDDIAAASSPEDGEELERYAIACGHLLGELYPVLKLDLIRTLVAAFVGQDARELYADTIGINAGSSSSSGLSTSGVSSSSSTSSSVTALELVEVMQPLSPAASLEGFNFDEALLNELQVNFVSATMRALVNAAEHASDALESLVSAAHRAGVSSPNDKTSALVASILAPLFRHLVQPSFISQCPSQLVPLVARLFSSYSWLLSAVPQLFEHAHPILEALLQLSLSPVHRLLFNQGLPPSQTSSSTVLVPAPHPAARSFASVSRACRQLLAADVDALSAYLAFFSSNKPGSGTNRESGLQDILGSIDLSFAEQLDSSSLESILSGVAAVAYEVYDPSITVSIITTFANTLLQCSEASFHTVKAAAKAAVSAQTSFSSASSTSSTFRRSSGGANLADFSEPLVEAARRLHVFTAFVTTFIPRNSPDINIDDMPPEDVYAMTGLPALSVLDAIWPALGEVVGALGDLCKAPVPFPPVEGEFPVALLVEAVCTPITEAVNAAGRKLDQRTPEIVEMMMNIIAAIASPPAKLLHAGPLNVMRKTITVFASDESVVEFFRPLLVDTFGAVMGVIFESGEAEAGGTAGGARSGTRGLSTNIATGCVSARQPFISNPTAICSLINMFYSCLLCSSPATASTPGAFLYNPNSPNATWKVRQYGPRFFAEAGLLGPMLRVIAEAISQIPTSRDVARAAFDAVKELANAIDEAKLQEQAWSDEDIVQGAAVLVRALLFGLAGEPDVPSVRCLLFWSCSGFGDCYCCISYHLFFNCVIDYSVSLPYCYHSLAGALLSLFEHSS